MSDSTREKLFNAMQNRQFVRLIRRFEPWPVRGYVMDVGPKFFLLCLVSDRLRYDGFECFRVSDVKSLKPDPYAGFAETALRLRKERRPRKPKVSLIGKTELLQSAGQVFPVVTIHREKVRADVCYIGKVMAVTADRLNLLLVDPSAKWDEETTDFPLRGISRVSFGGDYEVALCLVAGKPPV
jgi:hypothetical protein